MPVYTYCNLNVVSNIAISELPQTNNNTGLSFHLESALPRLIEPPWLYHLTSPSGEIILFYGYQDSYHWLRFPSLADFRISANTNNISCHPLTKIPEETIRHLLLDQVLPRCLAYQGKIMIHASAVLHEQGIILFLGDSGAGKSTLAGNFHQAGYPALSDDCLWIKESKDQVVAVPSYGGLRLRSDSLEALFTTEQTTYSMAHYSTKKRVPLNENYKQHIGNGIPVIAAIVLLPHDPMADSKVFLNRLSNREAFIAIMKQTFQLNLLDLERITDHMQALRNIILNLKAFRLSMPHEYNLLPLVRQKILEAVL